jgi:hypothetical protein
VARQFWTQGAFPEAAKVALGIDYCWDCCTCFIKVYLFEIAGNRSGKKDRKEERNAVVPFVYTTDTLSQTRISCGILLNAYIV